MGFPAHSTLIPVFSRLKKNYLIGGGCLLFICATIYIVSNSNSTENEATIDGNFENLQFSKSGSELPPLPLPIKGIGEESGRSKPGRRSPSWLSYYMDETKIIFAEEISIVTAFVGADKIKDRHCMFLQIWTSETNIGFDLESFHKAVKGVPNTLLLVESNYANVYGSFMTIPYEYGKGYLQDERAFLFTTRSKYRPYTRFSNVMKTSTFNSDSKAPHFGSCPNFKLSDDLRSGVFQICSTGTFKVLGQEHFEYPKESFQVSKLEAFKTVCNPLENVIRDRT